MSQPDFLVHDKADNVGVIVVETVEAGKQLSGLIMETGEKVEVEALDAIPLGHKIALTEMSENDIYSALLYAVCLEQCFN